MEQHKTQRELLEQLEFSGLISADQVDDIVHAPRWSFSVRELVTYLASLIIAVGVLRLFALALRDASEVAIALSLYVVAVAAALVSWKLSSKSKILRRFSEVLELAALGAAGAATALLLDNAEMRGEWVGIILTGAASLWGIVRCRAAQFSGTVSLSVGLVGLSMALSSLINQDSELWGGVLTLIAGALVVTAGLQRIGSPQFARAVGSLFVIIGSMMIGSTDDWSRPAPIIVGTVMFIAGIVVLAPEMLVAGAFCVVAGIAMTVVEWIDNEMAQGLVIIGTGLVVLAVLTLQMKRTVSRPTPGAQAA